MERRLQIWWPSLLLFAVSCVVLPLEFEMQKQNLEIPIQVADAGGAVEASHANSQDVTDVDEVLNWPLSLNSG